MKKFRRLKIIKKIGFIDGLFFKKKNLREINKNKFIFKKKTDYSVQLQEKQKIKKNFLLNEKQFKKIYKKCFRKSINFIDFLRHRFDSIIFFLKIFRTKFEIRQAINHKYFKVNDTVCNKPSRIIKVSDIIRVRKKFIKNIKNKNIKKSHYTEDNFFFDKKKLSFFFIKDINSVSFSNLSFYTR